MPNEQFQNQSQAEFEKKSNFRKMDFLVQFVKIFSAHFSPDIVKCVSLAILDGFSIYWSVDGGSGCQGIRW